MRKTKRLRWWIGTLLFLATLINYVDRQTLSVAIPVIRDEFGLSNTDYSRIVFWFLLAYTIMQVVSGKVIDLLGTRKGFSVFICWWSVAAMLHAFGNSALSFCVFRFLLGMGEAGNWPGAVKAVAEWFPPKERAVAAGFFNSGSSIGAVIAPPLITWVVVHFGWREAFVATGALGFVWLTAWLAIFRPPHEHPHITPEELAHIREDGQARSAEGGAGLRWIDLFRYRQLWALVAGRILSDPVWWFYVFWLPEYLKRQRNFSLAEIGMFAWIPFFTAGIGSFAGGGLSSYLVRRGWTLTAARKSVLVASAVLMIAGIPAALAQGAVASLALISLATFAYASWAAVFIALPTDIFPKEVCASVYGIAGTAAGFGGMLSTLATGKVVDTFSYVPVFVAAGVLPVIAAVLLVILLGRVEPIAMPGSGMGKRAS
jgi:ACS family hexuronate transporter-like MFS transporter